MVEQLRREFVQGPKFDLEGYLGMGGHGGPGSGGRVEPTQFPGGSAGNINIERSQGGGQQAYQPSAMDYFTGGFGAGAGASLATGIPEKIEQFQAQRTREKSLSNLDKAMRGVDTNNPQSVLSTILKAPGVDAKTREEARNNFTEGFNLEKEQRAEKAQIAKEKREQKIAIEDEQRKIALAQQERERQQERARQIGELTQADPEIADMQEAGMTSEEIDAVLKNRKLEKETQTAGKTKISETLEAEAGKNIAGILTEAPKVRESGNLIKTLEKISPNFDASWRDIKSFGVKNWWNARYSEDAAKFDSLAQLALEPVLKVFNPTGQIATEKMVLLKDKTVPLASDSRWGRRGKLDAAKFLQKEAQKQTDKWLKLVDQYGSDIPYKEVAKYNDESINAVDNALLNLGASPSEISAVTSGENLSRPEKVSSDAKYMVNHKTGEKGWVEPAGIPNALEEGFQ